MDKTYRTTINTSHNQLYRLICNENIVFCYLDKNPDDEIKQRVLCKCKRYEKWVFKFYNDTETFLRSIKTDKQDYLGSEESWFLSMCKRHNVTWIEEISIGY